MTRNDAREREPTDTTLKRTTVTSMLSMSTPSFNNAKAGISQQADSTSHDHCRAKQNVAIATDVKSLRHLECLVDAAQKNVKKCRQSGKQGDFDELVKRAREALDALKALEAQFADASCELHQASPERFRTLHVQTKQLAGTVHGFMGYALMKQGKYNEALTFLEKSLEIRQQAMQSDTQATIEKGPSTPRDLREAAVVQHAYEYCQSQISDTAESSSPLLIKYPRTTHLFDTGGTAVTTDDLVLSENDAAVTALCNGSAFVVIEEKIDGANLGILLDPSTQDFLVQNRSHFISSGEHPQFSRISEWIEEHRLGLRQVLCTSDSDGSLILYGEWLAARHSLPYHKLPGLFVAYDIFDKKQGKFYSRNRFHTIMRDSGIPVVPIIELRTFGPYGQRQQRAGLFRSELVRFLDTESAFRNDGGTVEGIVLRVDDAESHWLQHRYKVVRPDFVQGCNESHWMSHSIEKQRVDFAFALEYVTYCYHFAQTDEASEITDKTIDTTADKKMPATSPPPLSTREAKEYAAQRARARRRVPRCVMLMGLPASGKSTFASRLAESNEEWTVVNQDRLGKKACIALASKASRRNRVILDRCHPTAAERQEWHDTLGSPPKGDVGLVYFAANAETCIERAKRRPNHESIPHGTGERIVRCVDKMLEAPSSNDERLFGTIEIVSTFEESNALLHKWGVDGDDTGEA